MSEHSTKSLGELLKEKLMTSPVTPPPIEDLVKSAIKDALAKRTLAEGSKEFATDDTTMDSLHAMEKSLEPTPVAEVVPKHILKDGQVWASDLFKRILSISKKDDFPVSVFKPEDFDERIRMFIPKVDPTYVLDKKNSINILKGWEQNDKTLLYGPTGAGKSSLPQMLCAYVCRPFVRINCTEDMDSSMIFGQLTASDGSTHWEDGTVTEAVKYGAVFAWDEWDVTPPGIAMGLQWLLEDDGKLFLKEKPGAAKDKFIVPDSKFRLMALGNTQGQGDDTGQHTGTNVQNTATIDRFGTTLRIGYMKEDVEVKMLCGKFTDIAKETVLKLVRFANLVRQGYTTGQLNLTMSPRSTIGICKKLSYGHTMQEAIQLTYTNKLVETHQKVAMELYRKVFGSAE